ncbi:MAG: hypothetical protein RRZ64_00905 [Rikenellaceae bacterium]
MNKIFYIIVILTMTITTLTSCNDEFPQEPKTDPYFNIIASSTTVPLGGSGVFTIRLDRDVESDVNFTISSNNPALSLKKTSGTIDTNNKGREAKIDFTTSAEAEAIVTITSDYPGARYVTKDVKIKIVKPILSFSGSKSCIIGAASYITVSSNMEVAEDVQITITSNNLDILTTPKTMILPKGKKVISSQALGVAVGEAIVTVTTKNGNVVFAEKDGAKLNTLTIAVLPIPADISITGDKNAKVGDDVVFKIISDIAMTEDVTFTVTSSNIDAVTAPETLIMTKGTMEIEGSYHAVKAGSSTLTIASTNATVNVNSEKKSIEIAVVDK